MNTITVSPSRRALTIRRRRSLLLTSTTAGLAMTFSVGLRGASWVAGLRSGPSCPQFRAPVDSRSPALALAHMLGA
jgi:hypothetical protein